MRFYLKKAAAEHCDLLFKWSNDKEVRENSFTKDAIKYDVHVKWFNDKLNSPNCDIFIFYLDNVPVGQARIDVENHEAVISYSIDNNYRGRGLSTEMIGLLEKNVDTNVNKLIGYVKFSNVISQRVFEKLGYTKELNNNYIKYSKII